eukprot:COSAG06_NODE_58723_length_276_cov_0.689266_1_plen_32_part_10
MRFQEESSGDGVENRRIAVSEVECNAALPRFA